MDFTIPDELLALKERTERFVHDEILPRERDPRQTAHGPSEEFRRELVASGPCGGAPRAACRARMGRARA